MCIWYTVCSIFMNFASRPHSRKFCSRNIMFAVMHDVIQRWRTVRDTLAYRPIHLAPLNPAIDEVYMIYRTYVAKCSWISWVDHIHANFAVIHDVIQRWRTVWDTLVWLASPSTHGGREGLASLVYRFVLGSDFRDPPVAPIRLQNARKLWT